MATKNKINPFDILMEDHRMAEELFKKTEKSKGEEREGFFEELNEALTDHALLEESTLYPALDEISETAHLSKEAKEEHETVKELLIELEDISKDLKEWEIKFKTLKDMITHHVNEEEATLFPKAEEVLAESELKDLESQFKEAKKIDEGEVDTDEDEEMDEDDDDEEDEE